MAFGKPKKVEESINDKFVRLFKEGKTVDQISKEFDVKPDVIANVIRRRLGEDAIPDTVVRSKNAVPQHQDAPLKAEPANNEPVPVKAEVSEEGLSKLEQFMLEKEKKKAEEEPEEAEAPAETAEPEVGLMDGISLNEDQINAMLGGAPAENSDPMLPPSDDEADMAGLETADIAADEVIAEAPIDAYSEPDIVVEEPVIPPEPAIPAEPEYEPLVDLSKPKDEEPEAAPEPEPVKAAAPAPEMPHGNGSAFDKMKAFAKMQVAANNDRLAELRVKLISVEGDCNSRLEEAEKAVSEAKTAYEEVIRRGDGINDKRDALKDEQRTALARAEEEYRRKLEEIENEYNNATTRANREFAEKQDKLNAEIDQIDAMKEQAKQDFLTKQREVNKIKDKISSEVEPVKAEIASLEEENKGYESFLN